MEQPVHEVALSKAKIQLMSRPDSAFFTHLAFNLKHSFSESIPTAATDGRNVKYNPKFFMSFGQDERIFLILHEVMHCAYLHMERNQTRDQKRFNIAADHVINLQLIERGFKMPSCGLADKAYSGMSTEEVYNLLPPSPPEKPMGGFGQDLQEPGEAPEGLSEDIKNILIQASIQSKLANDKPGTVPGDIQIFLDNLLAPKLPWNRILQKYMQSMSKNDYSFRKPNRRFFPKHYLPSLYSENLMDLAAFADISGSVTNQEFHQQLSETASIMRMMKPSKITFGQFDTAIKRIDQIRHLTDVRNIQFTGRGGTRILPVIEWANTNKPQLLLIFTDGHFRFPAGLASKVPVIWLIYNNPKFTAPFGKVIHYKI